MEEVEGAFSIVVCGAAVTTVVEDLAVALPIGLDEDVSIDKRAGIRGVVDQDGAVLGIDQVELPIPVFDPVVAHDEAGGAVLEIVSAAAVA